MLGFLCHPLRLFDRLTGSDKLKAELEKQKDAVKVLSDELKKEKDATKMASEESATLRKKLKKQTEATEAASEESAVLRGELKKSMDELDQEVKLLKEDTKVESEEKYNKLLAEREKDNRLLSESVKKTVRESLAKSEEKWKKEIAHVHHQMFSVHEAAGSIEESVASAKYHAMSAKKSAKKSAMATKVVRSIDEYDFQLNAKSGCTSRRNLNFEVEEAHDAVLSDVGISYDESMKSAMATRVVRSIDEYDFQLNANSGCTSTSRRNLNFEVEGAHDAGQSNDDISSDKSTKSKSDSATRVMSINEHDVQLNAESGCTSRRNLNFEVEEAHDAVLSDVGISYDESMKSAMATRVVRSIDEYDFQLNANSGCTSTSRRNLKIEVEGAHDAGQSVIDISSDEPTKSAAGLELVPVFKYPYNEKENTWKGAEPITITDKDEKCKSLIAHGFIGFAKTVGKDNDKVERYFIRDKVVLKHKVNAQRYKAFEQGAEPIFPKGGSPVDPETYPKLDGWTHKKFGSTDYFWNEKAADTTKDGKGLRFIAKAAIAFVTEKSKTSQEEE